MLSGWPHLRDVGVASKRGFQPTRLNHLAGMKISAVCKAHKAKIIIVIEPSDQTQKRQPWNIDSDLLGRIDVNYKHQ